MTIVVLLKAVFPKEETALAAGNVLASTIQRYERADGSPTDQEDYAALVSELQQSAESGDADAMTRLGRMYREGIGVLQDFELAAKWIQTAADRGHPDAMLELGRLYRDGVGFQADIVFAYVWFNRAAAALNLDAVHEREDVASQMTPEQLRRAQELSVKT